MIKRLILFVLALSIVALSLPGCNDAGSVSEKEEVKNNVTYPPFDGERVVCIDAGHGFGDVGCSSELLEGYEAQVNLEMALLLKEELEELGCTVILTHDGEKFPSADELIDLCDERGIEYTEKSIIDNDIFSPYERALYSLALSREKSIDMFISLHVNSIENAPEVSRYEIDYYEGNPYSAALYDFCVSLQESLEKETVIFEDSHDMAYIVTKYSDFPSVLLEMGYATNEDDAADLNSEEFRKDFAKNLAERIDSWISNFEER